jgi:hypothetical protein
MGNKNSVDPDQSFTTIMISFKKHHSVSPAHQKNPDNPMRNLT